MPEIGLITVASAHNVRETMERLLAALTAHNMTVFARVDHAAGAASAGLSLRPTEVVLFGNPKGGTALMQDRQTAGIDLPLKALVWQDTPSEVLIGLTAPEFLQTRHGLPSAPFTEVVRLFQALIQPGVQP